jgi:hypothetical protein
VKVSRTAPSSARRRPGRTRAAVVAAGAALLLSSCSSTTPGVAAEVNGQRITDKQVDDFAKVLCSLSQGGSSGTTAQPTKTARFSSLQILLDNKITAGMTDIGSVPQASVAQAMQQLATSRDALPESQKGTFDTVARQYAQAQTAIIDLGRRSLEAQGKKNVSDQDAFTEGERLRTQYASKAGVKIDPRFGSMSSGKLQPSGGSLSVAVSDFARQADASQPSSTFVSQLPASQKCS